LLEKSSWLENLSLNSIKRTKDLENSIKSKGLEIAIPQQECSLIFAYANQKKKILRYHSLISEQKKTVQIEDYTDTVSLYFAKTICAKRQFESKKVLDKKENASNSRTCAKSE